MSAVTLHLTPAGYYGACDPDEPYTPEAFARDGFIHCTDGAGNVADTGNRHCRHDPGDYVVLVIDVAKVRPRIVYEDPGRIYPHIYGPLNRDAILAVVAVPRTADGAFLPPPLPAQ